MSMRITSSTQNKLYVRFPYFIFSSACFLNHPHFMKNFSLVFILWFLKGSFWNFSVKIKNHLIRLFKERQIIANLEELKSWVDERGNRVGTVLLVFN